jgi:hypothetical protein
MATTAQDLEDLKNLEQQLAMLRQVNAAELDRMNQSISAQLAGVRKIVAAETELGRERHNLEDMAKRLQKIRAEEVATGVFLAQADEDRVKAQEKFVAESLKEVGIRQQQLGFMRQQLSLSKALVGSVMELGQIGKLALVGVFASLPGYLEDTDAQLRLVARNTGMGADNMDRMRDSLIAGAMAAGRLGASTKELLQLQNAYSDATGRLQILSANSLVNLTAMAEGTNLGYEGAAKFAAQMGEIGYSAADTKKFTEGLVNDTERMGLNSGKVLETMSRLMDRAGSFSFQGGMGEGLEKMVQQAQRLKISVEGTFAAADKARTLEGSLGMASQLMVLGGNFAKSDPFQLAFLARNDPAKFQTALVNMTKGMASFNSESGQIEIAAYDMDRLRAAAEATGQPLENLVNSARKSAEISKMSSQLFVGTKEQRDTIMAMAVLGRNGKATIKLEGGGDIDLSKLTSAQAAMVMATGVSLEARAKQAQDFTKVFGAFVNELKSISLPLLNTLNTSVKFLGDVLDKLGPTGLKWVAGIAGGALALGKVLPLLRLGGAVGAITNGGGGIIGMAGRAIRNQFGGGGPSIPPIPAVPGIPPILPGGGAIPPLPTPPPIPPALPGNGTGPSLGGAPGGIASFSGAATLAAVGVAAVGIGFGFKMAAEGAAAFAASLKELNPAQLDAMQGGLLRLGLGIGVITLASAALVLAGAGAPAIAAIGLAAAGIGFGFKMAAEGAASFAKTLGNLDPAQLDAMQGGLVRLGLGIGAITLASAALILVGAGAPAIAAIGLAVVGIGYGFKLAAEGAGFFASSLEKLNPAQLDAMQGGLLRLGLGIGAVVLAAAGLAASGVGPIAVGLLLGVGAGVALIGTGVKLATDGIGAMMTSIAQLATADLSNVTGLFSKATEFFKADTSNLGKLQEAVNGLSKNTQNNMVEELKKLWDTPLKLDATGVSFQANIELTTVIDGDKFVNKFAKKYAAKIQSAAKGVGAL